MKATVPDRWVSRLDHRNRFTWISSVLLLFVKRFRASIVSIQKEFENQETEESSGKFNSSYVKPRSSSRFWTNYCWAGWIQVNHRQVCLRPSHPEALSPIEMKGYESCSIAIAQEELGSLFQLFYLVKQCPFVILFVPIDRVTRPFLCRQISRLRL